MVIHLSYSSVSETAFIIYLSLSLSLLIFSLQALDVGLPEDPDLKLQIATEQQLQNWWLDTIMQYAPKLWGERTAWPFITARLLEDITGVYIAANFHTVKTWGEMISNSGSPYGKKISQLLPCFNQTNKIIHKINRKNLATCKPHISAHMQWPPFSKKDRKKTV